MELSDADVDKTIAVLLKQRAIYEPVKRAAKKGDKVNIKLRALIDGEQVESTGEQAIDLVLGEGDRIAEFDEHLVGNKAGTNKTFDITYPADHKPEQLAGKTVSYEVTFNDVFQAKLPEVDAELARSLGVEDGDVEKMRNEIKQSLEQEVSKRISAKLKEQVFQLLLDNVKLEVPRSLIEFEMRRLMQTTQTNLQQRGVDLNNVNLEPAMFEAAGQTWHGIAPDSGGTGTEQ